MSPHLPPAFPWITVLTVLPLAGAVVALATHKWRTFARGAAVAFAVAAFGLTLAMWRGFHSGLGTMQYQELHAWAPAFGLEYHVGIDGLALLMLILSSIVVLMSFAASWSNRNHGPAYFAMVLFVEAGLFGTFTALNFLHWFFYWELSLIPAFFLIRIWGGRGRSRAATQFFVYSMAGSISLFLVFLAIFLATGSFDFVQLAGMARSGQLAGSIGQSLHWGGLGSGTIVAILFWGAFFGFAVKVPVYPFHGWLPEAYAEAPAETTMVLTGALSKMGVYGFLRILMPIFPAQMRQALTPLLWLAVASIVLPAFSAWAQKDLKRIFAHSSINHLGYCLLGICAAIKLGGAGMGAERSAALTGVMLQMFAHGITAAALFWFAALIERRSGLRGLYDFGGLRKKMPVFCGMFGIAIFASIGLPGLIGFPGEFLIFKGAYPLVTPATWISVVGLLVTAIFLLTILQRVFSGELNHRWIHLPDMTTAERLAFIPALILIFAIGLYPQVIAGMVHGAVLQIAAQVGF